MSSFNIDAVIRPTDPEIADLLQLELQRQQAHIELIASENFVTPAVLAAAGSVLTNKYAEGLPGKRYYGGCEHVDGVETLAIERLKALFGCDHANVQPHSGASANQAAFMAAGLNQGDTIMGMDLSHGGHLTHGSPVNFSGKYFNVVPYKVNPETGVIDMDAVRKLAHECKPKLIICGTSAYSRILDFKTFRDIAEEVGAILLADIAHIAGLVATGVHPSPVPYAHIVTTTAHKTLRGPRSGVIMSNRDLAKAVDKAVFPGLQGGPLMHIIAAKAIAFKEAGTPEFKTYATQVVANAKALAQSLLENGIDIVSGGTDTHVMMLDLRSLNLTGKEIEQRLGTINITTNKNTVPDDPQSPFVTSGIRLGTPAVTTRQMSEAEMVELGRIIATAIKDPSQLDALAKDVKALTDKHPLYPELSQATPV